MNLLISWLISLQLYLNQVYNLKIKLIYIYIHILIHITVCYVRSATLEMAITLLKKLTIHEGKTFISDDHIAVIYNAKEKILPLLRQFFKVIITGLQIILVIHET